MWALIVNKEKNLLLLKISETLTLDELSEFLEEIYEKNDGKFATLNRFVNLSALKEIKIDLDAVSSRTHEYRRPVKTNTPVRVSLFVPQRYIVGFFYLYKSMLGNDLFELEIFDSLNECAEYLSIDEKLLEGAVKQRVKSEAQV